ncbi:MAG TPA: lamin tail domain-containing protein [Williamwhitmania sp.]|nr:lamin tail domain-containing protein [Williamwhitmania sp.]
MSTPKLLAVVVLILLATNTMGQLSDNFESGAIVGWTQSPAGRWSASTDRPIDGIYSLKHTYDNSIADVDYIGATLNIPSIVQGTVIWRFQVKHGYAPSASNHWMAFLMSSATPAQMKAGTLFSGYAVGVNINESDDKLKIYKFYFLLNAQAPPQLLLETDLNWETTFGTTKPAAIEVERTASGLWTLRAGMDGTFANLETLGSFSNTDFGTMQNFVVSYTYTSSADRNLWIDNVSATFVPLNTNDRTTVVEQPIEQVPSQQIATTDTSQASAKELLRFSLHDIGGDGLPTKPLRMIFEKSSGTTVSLSNLLKSVELRFNNLPIPLNLIQIDANSITLEMAESAISVEEGATKEFSLWGWLKSQITASDDESVGLKISPENSGWMAALSGSDFADNFGTEVTASHTLEVLASKLQVANAPQFIAKAAPFSLTAAATDHSGNVDADYSALATLSLNSGAGNLSVPSGETQSMANGMVTWDNLTYSSNDSFTLKVTAAGLPAAISEPIVVLNDTTSTVEAPVEQSESASIPAGCTSNACAITAMKFIVSDKGGDGLPTIVTSISLFNAALSNAADWTKAIRFFTIHVNNETIALGNPTFTKTSCSIPILPGAITVAEGETKEVIVSVGLNDKVTDGEIVQLKIPNVNHGFSAQTTGSTFASTFPQDIISAPFTITVTAAKLIVKKMPTTVGVGAPFDAEVDAIDSYGNPDVDCNKQVTLVFKDGSGKITTFTSTAAAGKALFYGITFTNSGVYTLYATAENLADAPTTTITVADNDSRIIQSSLTISSCALATSSQDSILVMAFNIVDTGINDTLPTTITKAIIQVVPEDSTIPLKPIKELILKYADGSTLPIATATISSQEITLTFSTSAFSISNGTTKTITLWARPTQKDALDNATFRLKIPAANHSWETSSGSSLFAETFDYDILSPAIKQEVAATTIASDLHSMVAKDEPFNITFRAVDEYNNLDKDFMSPLSFLITDISSETSNIGNFIFIQGVATTNYMSINNTGKFWAYITSDGLPDTQFVFEVADKVGCDIDEDFESGELPAWQSIADWKIDQATVLNGTYSLRHNGLPSGNLSTLAIPGAIDLTKDAGIVSAVVKNGDWNPSSDNSFYLFVSYNQEVSSTLLPTGYAIGVNVSGDSDTLKVWYINKGIAQKELVSTNVLWSESTAASISLLCRPNGKQILEVNHQQFSFNDTLLKQVNTIGLVYRYTATRAGLLWADDISACRFLLGPKLVTATYTESNALRLLFSEEIANLEIQNNAIRIWSNGQEIPPQSLSLQGKKIYWVSNSNIPRHITVAWTGLKDNEGNTSSDSVNIDLDPFVDFGSVVINEIMADPTPAIGLPECEYVELFNRTSDTLSLNGWHLTVGNNTASLGSISILPFHYLTLTTTSCKTQGELGNTGAVGISSFPSLANAGATILLTNQIAKTISTVSYSSNWYGDSPKADGGYSLEKIDANNLSDNQRNWAASNDPTGGTPGRENSVMQSNPDTQPPRILSASIAGSDLLLLTFSECLNPKTISAEYFSTDNQNEIVELTLEGNPTKAVVLKFGEQFTENTIYELSIHSGITDLAGNYLAETKVPFALTRLPQWQEVVINELLFNPYPGSADFVEIYNPSTIPFNLKDLNLYRRNSEGELESLCRLCTTDRIILPNEYYAFSPSPSVVLPFYSCPKPENFFAASIPTMNDDAGTVVLTDTLGERIDEVTYSDKQHYKILASTEGVSLERVNPTLPPDEPSNWQSAAQTVGYATPVAKNSCFRKFDTNTSLLSIDPEIFSPNSDGYNDVTHIRFNLSTPGWSATITIYNSKGQEVRKLLNNGLVDVTGDVVWNGLNNSNQQVGIGIYVVVAELFNLNGEVKKQKKAVVVAGNL